GLDEIAEVEGDGVPVQGSFRFARFVAVPAGGLRLNNFQIDSKRGCMASHGRPGSAAASQTFTVPSSLPLMIRWPSELNPTLVTSLVCPRRERASWPVSASHTFNVQSSLPLMIRWPSGLNATEETGPVCPRRVRPSCPVFASQTFTVLSLLPLTM